MQSRYRKLAEERTRLHDDVGRNTVQVLTDRDLIGIIAEGEFALKYGGIPNFDLIPGGDEGYDFFMRGKSIDIKATTNGAGRLMVRCKLNRRMADMYVLGLVNIFAESCMFVGFATKEDVVEKGTIETYHGTDFFCLRQDQLRKFKPRQ